MSKWRSIVWRPVVSRSRQILRACMLTLEAAVALVSAKIRSEKEIDLVASAVRRDARANAEPDSEPNATPPILAAQLTRAVNRATPWATSGEACLPRALALRKMLSRRGVPSLLRLGAIRDPEGGLRAHAWLEVGGTVLIGRLPDIEGYRLLEPPS